ncbi:hypothetical protein BH23PLA1_BH23PLA1_31280 [soil metagenome]
MTVAREVGGRLRVRRKEVALGRLRTLTILLTLGAWGAATDGAPLDDASSPAPPSSRPPAPPVDYLRAGAMLFNNQDYDLAAQYLKAASDYRTELSASEQSRLDEYLEAMRTVRGDQSFTPTAGSAPSPVQGAPTPPAATTATPWSGEAQPSSYYGAEATPRDRASALVQQARQAMAAGRTDEAQHLARQADALNVPFHPAEDSPAKVLAELDPRQQAGTYPVESKSAARWLLHSAREDIARGQYDAAQEKIHQARAMEVRWGIFDNETPEKVQESLDKIRPKVSAAAVAPVGDDRERRQQAKQRLEEARAALEVNDYNRAEAIALEVNSWNLNYGMFEDNPTKVAAAARALRGRDGLRQAPPAQQPSQGTYDLLVQEARQLMAVGQFDEAEQKARHALRMNVVPPVTADRAEAVLNDLEMVKGHHAQAGHDAHLAQAVESPLGVPDQPAALAMTEPPHIAVEREADRLLATGDHNAAAAKYAEAERLRSQAQTMGAGVDASALMAMAARPESDPQVQPARNLQADFGPDGPELAPPPLQNLEMEMELDGPTPTPTPNPTPTPTPTPNPMPMEPMPAPLEMEQNLGAPDDPAILMPGPDFDSPPIADNPEPAADEPSQDLAQARSLFAGGTYEAARDAADRARNGDPRNDSEVVELLSQIDLAEQTAALKLYDAALDALRQEDNGRARALLNEAASMGDVLDDSTRQRIQDLLLRLPAEGQPAEAAEPLDIQMDPMAVEAQRMNAEVGTKVAEARRLLEQDPDQAITLLQQTITAVQAAGLSEPVARTMVRRLEVAIEMAQKDKLAFEAKRQDRQNQEKAELQKLAIIEAGIAKDKQVKEMMDRALEADANSSYAEAEAWARRVIEIDPNNVAAVALSTTARARRHYYRDLENRSAKEDTFLNMMLSVDETMDIPQSVIDGSIAYPKNFAELTQNRARFAQVESYKSPETLAVEEKLNETISLNMEDSTIGEAVEFLRNYTGLNVVLDSRALQDLALTRDAPVSLVVQNIKLKTALKFLLERHGLSYMIRDGVLVITTPQARGDTFTRVYQVTDLVIPPNPPKPKFGGMAAAQGVRQNGMGQSPFLHQASQEQGLNDPLASGFGSGGQAAYASNERQTDFGPLVQLITTTIAPGTWQVQDGTGRTDSGTGYGLQGGFGGEFGGLEGDPPIGSITPFMLNISLIIKHTAEVHDDIVDLLRQLRRLQDLQVSIEVRFITVNDDFFEQIGVDFDFSIHSDIVGPRNAFVQPNPAAVPIPPGPGGAEFVAPFLVNPARDHSLGRQPVTVGVGNGSGTTGSGRFTSDLQIPFLQNSFGPSQGLLNAVPGAGAQFGISFLSDLEVYLFMIAVQGNTRSNVVQAPKVTTFNGADATIIDFTTRNLVTSVIPQVQAGAVAFQPVIEQIPDGVTLNVTPVVTADRRYVRLTLAPTFTVIQGVDTFSFGAGAVGGGGLGGGAADLNTTIQQPILSTTTVITTVTVPDGGTVLLGGVKRLTEQRLEFGTPILSKTPLINRLFRNIGIGRSTDSLMLMVTPRIIILEEEAERLGIPAVPRAGYP